MLKITNQHKITKGLPDNEETFCNILLIDIICRIMYNNNRNVPKTVGGQFHAPYSFLFLSACILPCALAGHLCELHIDSVGIDVSVLLYQGQHFVSQFLKESRLVVCVFLREYVSEFRKENSVLRGVHIHGALVQHYHYCRQRLSEHL